MKIFCIYHANCADGFGAAWAVRHALGEENVEFFAGKYQEPPPDVTGRAVVIVDFSYKRDVLKNMVAQARTLLVLDHHKSAADDLGWMPQAKSVWAEHACGEHVGAVFDMGRSGAGLTWDYFHPGQRRPHLIDYIEDRDLWRFALVHTREIHATLFSYPYDFAVWDALMRRNIDLLAREGVAINRKHFKDVAELVAMCKRRMVIGGYDVPVASLPYTLASDAGHLMAEGEPFAACYYDTEAGRVFSLRSEENGVDVQAVAVRYGGGGHVHAAGFTVPRKHRLARA